MRLDTYSQPPFDRALQLLSQAGLSLPDATPGDPRWMQGVVQGLVQLAERAVAAPRAGAGTDAGFFVGPPYASEVSADERAMLFEDAPDPAQEQPA